MNQPRRRKPTFEYVEKAMRVDEGNLRSIYLGRHGSRVPLSLSWVREPEFGVGFNLSVSRETPLHVGVTLGRYTVFVQFFSED